MKTLAIKLDDELHAQLTMLGQVLSTPVTALMLEAVKEHVARLTKSDEVANKAAAMRAAIEADAASRRRALDNLLDGVQPAGRGDKRPSKPAKADQS